MWFESEDDLVVPAVRFLINDLINELVLREAAAKKKAAAACSIQARMRTWLAGRARVAAAEVAEPQWLRVSCKRWTRNKSPSWRRLSPNCSSNLLGRS
jgi:hypothetical protein